ncbi:MAG: hypothetical protein NZ828_03985 [Alphaproteobacteria bacterium]|nr:hypothetical protein [Alphaproteobacteria bacterium]MCS5596391.1 hypothetical protein [Alphaproteobacteria bacterium]|tara:strand:+ start:242 stop:727 length:486 start_codon:yes stop_codon:yes gene_type:complete
MVNKARIFKVDNGLKRKVGGGGFSSVSLARVQERFDACQNSPAMFKDLAEKCLHDMRRNIFLLERGKDLNVRMLRAPILDLKSNGQMFGYKSITSVCNNVLDLMQRSKAVNGDLQDLYKIIYNTIKLLVDGEIANDQDKMVKAFQYEIEQACERFRRKYGA